MTLRWPDGSLLSTTVVKIVEPVEKHGEGTHDEEAHGNWSRGSASTEFVSPNIEENLSWEQVSSNLTSARHAVLKSASHEINELVGIHSHEYAAVGSWGDGREESIVITTESSPDFDTVRVAAAMKGLLADQKAVIAFRERPGGRAGLYVFDLPSKDVRLTSAALAEHGVQYHTLVPQKDGIRVYVFSPDGGGDDDVRKAATALGTAVVYGAAGDGEFIGSDSSRPRGRAHYREVIDGWLGARGGRDREAWAQLYRTLAERVSRVTKSILGGLFWLHHRT